ncbi:MAG: hypothetical protein Q9227_000208 [Pyrenula ochraceoflavens]
MAEAESSRGDPDREIVRDAPQNVEYDTCFGVILIDAMSSFNSNGGNKIAPVTMQRYDDMIKLRYQDSNKYAGILLTPVLGKILDDFSVKYEASLVGSLSEPTPTRKQKKGHDPTRQRKCCVRVVVYGLKEEESKVGDLLSDDGLFLQQPSAAECLRNTNYSNPHYLVRPGSEMPAVDRHQKN